MSLLFIALGMGIIAWIDVPGLVRQEQWRDLAFYAGLWLLAAAWGFAIALDIPMPIIGSYISMATHAVASLFTGGASGGS